MFRPPSLLSCSVFTGSLVIAGLVALGVGGFSGFGGSTSPAGLSAALTSAAQHPAGVTSAGTATTASGATASGATAAGAAAPAAKSARRAVKKTAPRTAATTAAAVTTMAAMPGMTMGTPPVTAPILAPVPLAGTVPSTATPPNRQYHEFQVNCTITDHRPDDPIVFPGLPGASHNHTFFGNRTTDAASTLTSLSTGTSSCKVPADLSAYWMPTLYNGTKIIDPKQTITYYKSGVKDYTSVRPFPKGLRFVTGSPSATEAQFGGGSQKIGYWSCKVLDDETHIPANCPAGNQLIGRLIAPSCWDGVHLDVPDHHSNMAYPVKGVCPKDHPVAVPMLQFKIAYPVSGDMSQVKLSSGGGQSFHYDFFNDWDDATQAALVKGCINGGRQCDAQGYDQHYPDIPAVLGADYRLHH